jgi:hypothetical protein
MCVMLYSVLCCLDFEIWIWIVKLICFPFSLFFSFFFTFRLFHFFFFPPSTSFLCFLSCCYLVILLCLVLPQAVTSSCYLIVSSYYIIMLLHRIALLHFFLATSLCYLVHCPLPRCATSLFQPLYLFTLSCNFVASSCNFVASCATSLPCCLASPRYHHLMVHYFEVPSDPPSPPPPPQPHLLLHCLVPHYLTSLLVGISFPPSFARRSLELQEVSFPTTTKEGFFFVFFAKYIFVLNLFYILFYLLILVICWFRI